MVRRAHFFEFALKSSGSMPLPLLKPLPLFATQLPVIFFGQTISWWQLDAVVARAGWSWS
jgi:hypothetical protein